MRPNAPRQIYFIGFASGEGPIKIGCSQWPKDRLRQFQWSSGVELELLASAVGGLHVEDALHRRFAQHRVDPGFSKQNLGLTEWFARAPEVINHIEFVKSTGEHGVEDSEIRFLEVARMRREGKTFREIAEVIGVTRGGASALYDTAIWHERMAKIREARAA